MSYIIVSYYLCNWSLVTHRYIIVSDYLCIGLWHISVCVCGYIIRYIVLCTWLLLHHVIVKKWENARLVSDQTCLGYCSHKCVYVVHRQSRLPVYWATISIYGNFDKYMYVHNSFRLPVLTSVLWKRNWTSCKKMHLNKWSKAKKCKRNKEIEKKKTVDCLSVIRDIIN